jgi:hypothetical protein
MARFGKSCLARLHLVLVLLLGGLALLGLASPAQAEAPGPVRPELRASTLDLPDSLPASDDDDDDDDDDDEDGE